VRSAGVDGGEASQRSSGKGSATVRLCCPVDLYGAVAAAGMHECLYAPTYLVFDPMVDGRCGEHDCEVGFDRVAFAVIDRPGV
jgi:hypothetical protein